MVDALTSAALNSSAFEAASLGLGGRRHFDQVLCRRTGQAAAMRPVDTLTGLIRAHYREFPGTSAVGYNDCSVPDRKLSILSYLLAES